uniref:RNA-directed DNA polymerase, eukaryota n=1 Tax=Tanacetum cinerariifolium TaxID=118510 RepID=A0A6L2LN25_TANCI|nr:RNA-directed DNA polymerase, eukaryota [Tanacetum cinerariifolium]
MVNTFRRAPGGGVGEEQLSFLLSHMDGLILTNIHDRWIWSLEATSEFSVKSVRKLIDDSILPKEEGVTRWVKVMPIKINVFAWRLTQDDLKDLIVKYNIPRDLHPWMPSEDFVMSGLLTLDALGFIILGPLRLNKVVNFEVLCRSLQIKSSVTLFRVFQTLCKQGIRVSAIDDLKLPVGFYNQDDVRRLSVHVVKLKDMPEGVSVLSVMGIHDFFRRKLRYIRNFIMISDLPYNGSLSIAPHAAADVVILDPSLEDLAAGTPSAKVMDKAEASKKQKASISGVASSHVAKRTWYSMAQSSKSTTQPNLFATNSNKESDDEEDACVEIPLVTHIKSATVIQTKRNQSGAIPGLLLVTSPLFKIFLVMLFIRSFFPFFPGPYYATYPGGGIAGSSEFTREEWDAPHQPTLTVLTKEVFKELVVCKTVVDQFPTPGKMVHNEALIDDQLTIKMSVLHCLMMSHRGELLARYWGLLKSHHDYAQSVDSRLKRLQERCDAFQALESQSLVRKFLASDEFSRVQDEFIFFAASAEFECGLSVDQTQEELAAVLNKDSDHAAHPLSVILQLKPEKLARPGEQDSGNIDKTQSKATPNESSSQKTDLGGGPRCQEDIGDTTDQTRGKKLEKNNRSRTHKLKRLYKVGFTARVESSDEESLGEDASKQERIEAIDQDEDITLVNDQDDAEMFDVNDLGGEDVFVAEQEVVSTAATIITTKELNLAQALEALKTLKPKKKRKFFAAKRAGEKRKKPLIQAHQKKITCTYLKNMKGCTLKQLKSFEFDKIQEMFDKAFKRANTFEDFRAELVQEKEKRAGEALIQESTNKQKVEDDKETADLKQLMEIIPDKEEVAIDAIPLAVKSL